MSTTTQVFLAITAPHFTAGVIVGGKVAPIIKYMKHWTEEQIRDYCFQKGWKCIDVEKAVADELIRSIRL